MEVEVGRSKIQGLYSLEIRAEATAVRENGITLPKQEEVASSSASGHVVKKKIERKNHYSSRSDLSRIVSLAYNSKRVLGRSQLQFHLIIN